MGKEPTVSHQRYQRAKQPHWHKAHEQSWLHFLVKVGQLNIFLFLFARLSICPFLTRNFASEKPAHKAAISAHATLPSSPAHHPVSAAPHSWSR